MKVVFVGATRGIGRALARLMAERGDRLFLLGRDPEQLERSAADLLARGAGSAVGRALLDLERPEGFASALAAADRALEGFDTAVITAGILAPQEALEGDAHALRRLLDVDFTHTVLLCEALRERLLARRGTLCVLSSVAGDRGRKPVVLYGAAKAGLSRYLEGLDHRFHDRGLRVVTVKPGFVKTSMTDGLPVPPFAGEPQQVARDVLRAIDRGRPVVYTPWPWRWVMLIIRLLPRAVMRRVAF
ncbi:MAG TPA: SDR family NAD(P)-dependent oxidoreductase [Thermoanaerobaculia bacterium]|nr:SDR family NAD(P)-dependent oxidoreductase [Thermoanaerobaculia bacterium]